MKWQRPKRCKLQEIYPHKRYTAFETLKNIDFYRLKIRKNWNLHGLAANGIAAAKMDIPENAFPTSSSSMHLVTTPLDEEKMQNMNNIVT